MPTIRLYSISVTKKVVSNLSDQFAHTIIPWLMGGLVLLILLSAGQTIRFWRESKRSPYYFLRRQAEQSMQTYSLATIGLMMTSLFVFMYIWQGPRDNVTRIALITSAKPAPAVAEQSANQLLLTQPIEISAADVQPEVVVVRGTTFSSLSQNIGPTADLAATADAPATAEPLLPAEFDQYEPQVQLTDNTSLSKLSFSTEVDDDLQALNPRRLFNEGYFKLYATFTYEEMADGMEWAWVWRHEGEVINGGNELWAYGDEGPGYVFLNPPEGFQPGQYTVEIWVNGQLMSQSNLFVTTDVAANN